jgi:hypothetical protein
MLYGDAVLMRQLHENKPYVSLGRRRVFVELMYIRS